ncbi:MAG: hypothetical protein ACOYD9_01590 [Pyramidobacter sp.]|jgi:hypothetical protein
MASTDWKYYNHAAIPATAPHETPDLTPLRDGSIWNMPERPLLVRWTEHFDCAEETNWWYCIKDTPYEPEKLKSTRRYKINKGRRYFSVALCNPLQMLDEIYRVATLAFSDYPASYRPRLNKDTFIGGLRKTLSKEREFLFFGAWDRLAHALSGYACLSVSKSYARLNVLRAVPSAENHGVNAALIDGICRHFADRLASGFYICDGERNILHETHFYNYLGKYFGFRKAYAELHLRYRKDIAAIVWLLYPFRALIKKCPGRLPALVSAVLKMEEIVRQAHLSDSFSRI